MALRIQTEVGRQAPIYIDACPEKAAQKQLCDWVTELDSQEGPSVEVSITDLIGLHVAGMRLKGVRSRQYRPRREAGDQASSQILRFDRLRQTA
jgi:hypothetical protein